MSRLGKKPVLIPKNVEVKIGNNKLQAKGPKGQLELTIEEGIHVSHKEDGLHIEMKDSSVAKAKHGLVRALVSNLVNGVATGFEKRLSLVGVGYRAAVQGKLLDLQLGYSHPTKLEIPADIQVAVDKNVLIVISGPDKQAVGQFAAKVRSVRPPEPYKGKGVRYEKEFVRKKAGKAAKGKG